MAFTFLLLACTAGNDTNTYDACLTTLDLYCRCGDDVYGFESNTANENNTEWACELSDDDRQAACNRYDPAYCDETSTRYDADACEYRAQGGFYTDETLDELNCRNRFYSAHCAAFRTISAGDDTQAAGADADALWAEAECDG